MTPLGKFAKGFVFGGTASLVTVLSTHGCRIASVEDLQAFGLAALSGVLAGGLHAAWNAYFVNTPME